MTTPFRKSSANSSKVAAGGTLSPSALQQAWILNKSNSETSLLGSRRKILPSQLDNINNNNTAPTNESININGITRKEDKNNTSRRNIHTAQGGRKSSLQGVMMNNTTTSINTTSSTNENPTKYNSKRSISPLIGVVDPNIPTPPITDTSNPIPYNANIRYPPPVAIAVPQVSDTHSRASSVTSSTMSPTLNMLRWFQGTNSRAITPIVDNTTNTNNIGNPSTPSAFSPKSPKSPTSTNSSKRSSKVSTVPNGSNSRSNSSVSLAAAASKATHQLARHRWKEGIITVMAANRFIQAAESRRERLANEEEIKEQQRQQRILKERAIIRKNREDKLQHQRTNMRHLFHNSTSPNQINSYIWIGSMDDAKNTQNLINLGITHILNTAKQVEPDEKTEELFIYKKISIMDTPDEDLLAILPEAFEFIQSVKSSGGTILVHCVAGISRSVAIVAAWLMEHEHAHLKYVMELIRQRRPIALPNTGFRLTLAHREIEISGGTSVAKLRHDPMWNFNDWRNEENQYKPREGDGQGTLSDTAIVSSSNSCCIIM